MQGNKKDFFLGWNSLLGGLCDAFILNWRCDAYGLSEGSVQHGKICS